MHLTGSFNVEAFYFYISIQLFDGRQQPKLYYILLKFMREETNESGSKKSSNHTAKIIIILQNPSK